MPTITIAGEPHTYTLNMGALEAISKRGYSGEGDEGDFARAFYDAEQGDTDAMRLVAWAGLLAPYQSEITGAIDFDAAPPLSLTNRMTFAELMEATAVASAEFIGQLPQGTIEAMIAAAEKAEADAKAAEAAGRPTTPRSKKKA